MQRDIVVTLEMPQLLFEVNELLPIELTRLDEFLQKLDQDSLRMHEKDVFLKHAFESPVMVKEIRGLLIIKSVIDLYTDTKNDLISQGKKPDLDGITAELFAKVADSQIPLTFDMYAKLEIIFESMEKHEGQCLVIDNYVQIFRNFMTMVFEEALDNDNEKIKGIKEEVAGLQEEFKKINSAYNAKTSGIQRLGERGRKLDIGLNKLTHDAERLKTEREEISLELDKLTEAANMIREKLIVTPKDFEKTAIKERMLTMMSEESILKDFQDQLFRQIQQLSNVDNVKYNALTILKDDVLSHYDQIVSGKISLLQIIENWKDKKVSSESDDKCYKVICKHKKHGGSFFRSTADHSLKKNTSKLIKAVKREPTRTQAFIDHYCDLLDKRLIGQRESRFRK